MFCLKIDVVDFFLKNLYSEENLKWKFDLTLHYPSSFFAVFSPFLVLSNYSAPLLKTLNRKALKNESGFDSQ